MKKAQECARCRFWRLDVRHLSHEPQYFCECIKGHRPRFYYGSTYKSVPVGYRRVCEDFGERGKHESE